MTKRLHKAFQEASKLPDGEQDTLAEFILEEIASECRWAEAFAKSADKLSSLADEARSEFQSGRTNPLETDR